MKEKILSVAIFAHNEEKLIANCLLSILKSGDGVGLKIYVLANGCVDSTVKACSSVINDKNSINIIELENGDKSAAWNHYVYEIADKNHHHVFIDGDLEITRNSFTVLRNKIKSDTSVFAFSTTPHSGRNQKRWSDSIIENHDMPGGFYCLPSKTLKLIKEKKIFMPVGLIGDDTFLQWILKRNFNPSLDCNDEFIYPIKEIGFLYESIPLIDYKSLLYRHKRYALRNIQIELLIEHLQENGINKLPPYISSLYKKLSICRHLINNEISGISNILKPYVLFQIKHGKRYVEPFEQGPNITKIFNERFTVI